MDDMSVELDDDLGPSRRAPEPPDPIAAYRALAAVLTEIKAALGPDALLDHAADDVSWVTEHDADEDGDEGASRVLERIEVPGVPFAVSIVPDRDPEPLQPLDTTVDAAAATAVAAEDLVPHHRRRPSARHRFGRRHPHGPEV